MTHHRPIQVKELYDYVMEKRSKVDAFEDEFKVIQCKYYVYTFYNIGFANRYMYIPEFVYLF